MTLSGRLSLRRAHVLVATFGGAGLAPLAPGTVGSAAALPLGWLIAWLAGPWAIAAAAGIAFAAGVWAADRLQSESGRHDAGYIVIDEVAGQWLALAAVPPDWLGCAAAFATFRLFDIVKPWPASWADGKVGGGLGVMLDDVLAGGMAALALMLIGGFSGWW